MTIAELQILIDSGEFHHATYRNIGTLWEGLHIYGRNPANGFDHVGFFPKGEEKAAYALVSQTGVSLGSYGQG